MEYEYSGVDDNSKVCMLMNGINTNTLDTFKASILASLDMQGYFDIAARHLLEFIKMNPSIQNNTTAKVSSVNRSGGGRVRGSGIDHESRMPAESDVHDVMSDIKEK